MFGSELYTMRYNIKQPIPGAFHIETKTQHELTSLFIRIQEFYESPYENIKGKVFTLDEYMDTYAEDTGGFTYTTDWNGFNVPGNVVKEFFKQYPAEDLRENERALYIELCLALNVCNYNEMPEHFYLLGSIEGVGCVLEHEIAHALYYLDEEYSHSMNVKIHIHHKDDRFAGMKKTLLGMGYCEDMLEDELQAYLTTTNYKGLYKLFGFFNVPWREIKGFRELYRSFV